MKFEDVEAVNKKLKSASVKEIVILHRLIFDNEKRRNRKNLRSFKGYSFNPESAEYKDKLKNILDKFNLSELITVSNLLGLDSEGDKDTLGNLIMENLNDLYNLAKNNEINVESEDDEDTPHEVKNVTKNVEPLSLELAKLNINFKDVEDTIAKFGGSDNDSVEKFISDFEETSELMQWSDLHKFIFMKKSLIGLAKLFIQSETGVNSYTKLKQLLREEFSSKFNSAKLHAMLVQRKMKTSETVQEYFLTMRELANKGNVETEALIDYVIQGIPDSSTNKSILYGATDIKTFKDKLKIYEKIRADNIRNRIPRDNSSKFQNKNFPEKDNNEKRREIRCYNCGGTGHKSNTCDNKNKGFKCYKCNNYGHKANECVENSNETSREKVTNLISTNELNLMHKQVMIGNVNIISLIDTGSNATLLSESVYQKLNAPQLETCTTTLKGFGNSKVKTLGYFEHEIVIDNCEFQTKIYVVNDLHISSDLIIGTDIIEQGELIINQDGIKMRKSSKVTNYSDSNETLSCKIASEENPNHEDMIQKYTQKNDRELSDCKPKAQEISLPNLEVENIKIELVNLKEQLKLSNKLFEDCRREVQNFKEVSQQKLISAEEQLRKEKMQRRKTEIENCRLREELKLLRNNRKPQEVNCREVCEENGIDDEESDEDCTVNDSKQVLSNDGSKIADDDGMFQISKIQEENIKNFNEEKKDHQKYQLNDLVAIKKTQFGPHLQFRTKYFGPYRITKVKGNDTYDVVKGGSSEGPDHILTSAEFMKSFSVT